MGTNSWGDDYGILGRFRFSFNDLERLLNEDGDSVQLVPLDELTPEPELGSHARQTLTRLGLFKVHLVQVHKIG